MIELLRKLDRDLLCDYKTGAYNWHKIGNVVVGAVWTFYMLVRMPDSVEMWLAYSAAIMGFAALQYGQKRRGDRIDVQVGKEPPPPGAA